MKAALLGLLVTSSGLAALAALGTPGAKAACLTDDLIGLGTDCVTFQSGLSATAKVVFSDPNLNANPNFQLGFFSSGASPINISNLTWSSTMNGTYQTLMTGSFVTGVNSTYAYSSIESSSAPASPIPVGAPFWVKYDIPAGLAPGTVVSVQLRSNGTGAFSGTPPVLDSGTSTPQSVVLARNNTAVFVPGPSTDAAPGPLPLLGAASAFGMSRRLRRRIQTAA